MSYILDALRRADAERERGQVPGLHSQVSPRSAVPPTMARNRRGRRNRRTGVALALGGTVLAIALAWWIGRASTDTPPDTPPDASPATSAGSTAVASGPVSAAPTVVAPPAAAAPAPTPTPTAAPAPAPATTAEPVRPILAPAPPPPPAPRPAPAQAAPEPPRLADLSPEARAQIPALQVSGSTYSDNAALRMLIINGKVVQEGQDIAPELKLESIAPRTAIVNHRGQRYRISH